MGKHEKIPLLGLLKRKRLSALIFEHAPRTQRWWND
jgi:hypothetical protein